MTQPLSQRINYHPDPRDSGGAYRKVDYRLDFITSKVDFESKVVLDLGCSGGFFSFALAKGARKIIAVDGDEEMIERNKKIQEELGVSNIEFVHANINKELLLGLEDEVDIVLMLSVFHHFLSNSKAYGWNKEKKHDDSFEVIDAINAIAREKFLFEIGFPNEGYEWCERIPDFGDDWDLWVEKNIFRGKYGSVDVFSNTDHISWINRKLISKLSTEYKADTELVKRLKILFRCDGRDFRHIYIGQK